MSTKLQQCVYVLLSQADGKLYAGYSTDLKQRLTDHFNGRVPSTAPRRPLHLIYCEYHSSKTDALRREKYLKTTAGKKALRLMLRDAMDGHRRAVRTVAGGTRMGYANQGRQQGRRRSFTAAAGMRSCMP